MWKHYNIARRYEEMRCLFAENHNIKCGNSPALGLKMTKMQKVKKNLIKYVLGFSKFKLLEKSCSFCLFIYLFAFEIGSHGVSHPGVDLQSSCLTLLNAGITGMYHHSWLSFC
jgi:hypothetical protein